MGGSGGVLISENLTPFMSQAEFARSTHDLILDLV